MKEIKRNNNLHWRKKMSKEKKKYIYDPITVFDSLYKGLLSEGDRATVILAVAKIDLILFQILQKFLVSVSGSKDELLDNDKPLSTLSAKINMTYRLGLINNSFSHSLHLIRKIRNDFAHEVEGCTLNSGAHRDRVRELIAPAKNLKDFDKICDIIKKGDKFALASVQFRAMIVLVCLDLENLFEDCNALSAKDALDLFDASKKLKKISKTKNI